MTLQVDSVRRRARNGRGLLPPNPNQWLLEHNGLDLREALGLSLDVFLPHELAFNLVPNARVLPHGDLPLAQTFIDHFRRNGSAAWSGMAITMPDGQVWVLYNDSHTSARIRATLMEEFFHLWLGHPPSRLRVYWESAGRSHDSRVENEAYGSGAAALVPYQALRKHVDSGESVTVIARFFGVSSDLVIFRAKVTRLYHRLMRPS